MTDGRNIFFVHQPLHFAAPGYVVWDPHDASDVVEPLCVFWGHVLSIVDRAFPNSGYRFYLTWSNDLLPEYGDHVIAIQVTDDRGRIPAYAGKIGLTFKQFGLKYPFPFPRFEWSSFYVNYILTRIAATLLKRLPYAFRAYRRVLFGEHPHLVSLPGGYFHGGCESPPPMNERNSDVTFLGSLEGNTKLNSRFFPSLKFLVRKRMLGALDSLQQGRPQTRIRTKISQVYTEAIVNDPDDYVRALYDSKICLAPQGLASESYRYHEAMRSGAVVVSGPLPKYSYFAGAPAITVHSWHDLTSVASSLLADPAELQERQTASIRWWDDHCSETAVARRMVDAILRVRSRRCSCLA